jgi:protein-S-isoprenylcysteine O-methyltransferase Ste14
MTTPPHTTATPIPRIKPYQVIMMLVAMVFLPALILFGLAGRLDWVAGWVYLLISAGAGVLSRLWLLRYNPALAAERGAAYEHKDAKAWDRWLMISVGLLGPLVILVVAGLDERYGWSAPVAPGLQIAALIVILLATATSIWALMSNPFSPPPCVSRPSAVTPWPPAGRTVSCAIPATPVACVVYLAMPVLLESWWALVPAVGVMILIFVRTSLEDRTLHEELDGYRAYAARMRYRLIPGVG